jgi:hypothetical protein
VGNMLFNLAVLLVGCVALALVYWLIGARGDGRLRDTRGHGSKPMLERIDLLIRRWLRT